MNGLQAKATNLTKHQDVELFHTKMEMASCTNTYVQALLFEIISSLNCFVQKHFFTLKQLLLKNEIYLPEILANTLIRWQVGYDCSER